MARSKTTARKGHRTVPEYVRLGDPFPSRLIRFVEQLPDDPKTIPTPTPQEEPSAKRRKLDSSRNYLSVAKAKLSFSRHRDDDTNEGLLIERRNVGMHARIIPSEAAITFSSLRKASSNFSPLQISMSPCIDEDARQIVRISKLRSYDGAPGAIWSTVDVKAEHQGNHTTMTITYSLFWNETLSPFSGLRTASHRDAAVDIIKTFYPVAERPTAAQSPLDFYEAAFVPPKDDVSSTIEIPGLEASLFPYQKRTLQWLLNREGVRWSSESRGLQELSSAGPAPVTESSREVQDAHGQKFYLNDAFQTVSSDMSNYYHAERAARGGILAEEMGLGKTLEILGLILLHTRENSKSVSNVAVLPDQVPSNATLIVTPESLRRQWMAELSRHAPNLHFEFYQGCKRTSDEDMKVVQKLAACDVVITTYSILSAELHFTNDPPERSRRQERKYKRLKSPLVQISWWRLCLDEAQMVENGFSQAATVARVIPRVNAWGITGTPARDDIDGLFGLLRFLRYEPLCSAQRVWRYIISDQRPVFQKLFNSLALRHTKAMVRDEIALPPQRRYTISIPFTAVEEQHYQSIFKEMADACGLDTHGDPVVEDWTPDKYEEEMRIWLNRLRQTALHPEVGSYNRRVLGQNKTRPMRTVDEVLDAMLYQSENTIRTEERALLSNQLIRGQLLENSPRVKEALEIWKTVRAQTYRLVSEARAELETVLREHQENNETPKRIRDIENSSESDEDDLEEESKGRVGECRRKLRSALEMQHKAVFFCANAYFQIRDNGDMTTPDSEEFHRLKTLEERGYEEAKAIRREILKESHRKANRLMTRVMRKASQQVFTEISELVAKPEQGIESGSIVEGLEELYDELNEQANVIDEWREHVVQLLLKTLLDQEDDVETTGEELGEAAKIQDELMVYVQVLRATIADRQDAMTGQMNELVKYETQTSMRMAKNEEGPAPAKLLELFEVRQRIKPQMSRTSMRGAISEFRSLMSRLGNDKSQTQRAALEHRIAQGQLQATLAALSAQTKVVTSLESELEDFTMTMNARLEYYRQLQSVSDSVLPYDGARTEEAVAKSMDLEKTLQRKLASAQAKHRYLLNLKDAGAKSNEPRMCVICQTTFETGVLTVCGHQFCKACMMMWFRAHRNCPVCKRHLEVSQLHDITMKPQELQVRHEDVDRGEQEMSPTGTRRTSGMAKKTMIYSAFDSQQLAEIKNIELDGPSYTTKVDTLVRHLLWLRENDPGAKSIVFSQYKDFLTVLSTAFQRFRIGHASIDARGGTARFKDDPAVECFLLHARAHASGLNLVNANHVFLCEPLVNTALELQAIARVDRIGQQHETTVWLYLTSGTVEESIYNLSVKRRMEHMGKTDKGKSKESTPELLDASLEAANTLELEQAALTKLMSKDRTAGEVVDKGDLWECLFGHAAGRGTALGEAMDVD